MAFYFILCKSVYYVENDIIFFNILRLTCAKTNESVLIRTLNSFFPLSLCFESNYENYKKNINKNLITSRTKL